MPGCVAHQWNGGKRGRSPPNGQKNVSKAIGGGWGTFREANERSLLLFLLFESGWENRVAREAATLSVFLRSYLGKPPSFFFISVLTALLAGPSFFLLLFLLLLFLLLFLFFFAES